MQHHQHCANLTPHSINSPLLILERNEIMCQGYFYLSYKLLLTERRLTKTDPKRLNYESSITNQPTVGLFVTQKRRFSKKILQNPTSLREPDRRKICVSARFVFELKCWQCADWEKTHNAHCKLRRISYMIESAAVYCMVLYLIPSRWMMNSKKHRSGHSPCCDVKLHHLRI